MAVSSLPPAPALTRSEQRVLAVVVVPAHASRRPDEHAEALRAVTAERGAQLEHLADGSLLAVLSHKGGASHLVTQAAQCALAMRSVLPNSPMALTMGRGELDARLAAGAIDRAAQLLLDERGVARESATGIVLDEPTAALLDARFELARSDGRVELRRELVLDEAPRTLLGKPTECVGRERELASLEGIFAQCEAESVARAVLVAAPAGLGKSRLRNELVTRLRRRAAEDSAGGQATKIWSTRGDPMRTGSAFGLAAQLLRQACGLSEAEPRALQQERLRSRVMRHAVPTRDEERVTEFLAELAGVPFDDEHSPQLRAARQDAMLLGDQIRRAWEDFVHAESRRGPCSWCSRTCTGATWRRSSCWTRCSATCVIGRSWCSASRARRCTTDFRTYGRSARPARCGSRH